MTCAERRNRGEGGRQGQDDKVAGLQDPCLLKPIKSGDKDDGMRAVLTVVICGVVHCVLSTLGKLLHLPAGQAATAVE